ncbi:MAG TPA: DUF4399 domain-containing protein [Chitinophagaceae bacterium]|nr:DUF4399 domain-containing protein [Chitinophagaceae bacterium]
MKIKFLLPVACIAILAACNSSSDKKENKEDSAMNKTDTMHHMPGPGVNIPDLPQVPEGAKVFFKNLEDDAKISSPFKLEMGTEVIRIDTAGPVVAGSGHHHLFIDAEDSLAAGTVVPKDSAHIHFGKGQTEYELNLTPGKHKLTLQMADGLHRSYGSKLAATITVKVKK